VYFSYQSCHTLVFIVSCFLICFLKRRKKSNQPLIRCETVGRICEKKTLFAVYLKLLAAAIRDCSEALAGASDGTIAVQLSNASPLLLMSGWRASRVVVCQKIVRPNPTKLENRFLGNSYKLF
jgi:hypothetical protein